MLQRFPKPLEPFRPILQAPPCCESGTDAPFKPGCESRKRFRMSIWSALTRLLSDFATPAFSALGERVRTLFSGDPQTRRQVAFSIAMIALSAKMAKADGVVTADEIAAFRDIFEIPQEQAGKVAGLYNLAKQDTAGYRSYAQQVARLCGSGQPDCPMLEDILDGLFHIAKADGVLHEREVDFLRDVSVIFDVSEPEFQRILARHGDRGAADPWTVLGLQRDASHAQARRRYLELVRENHPDTLVARGVPPEFIGIANSRLAAINAAWDTIEPELKRQ